MKSVKSQVETVVLESLAALQAKGVVPASLPSNAHHVSPAKDPKHGDFASNAAMVLAKTAGKKPQEIAAALKDELLARGTALITSAEMAGPGFLNIKLHAHVWHNVALEVMANAAHWGESSAQEKLKVMVEFTSANPTGPLHVAHGRGTVLGDTISGMLKAAGHDVVREFYTNDYGNQVDTLGRSVHLRYRELLGETIVLPPNAYPADYIKDIARVVLEKHGPALKDVPESMWLPICRAEGIAFNIAWIKRDLLTFNVHHDHWVSEAELHASGTVKALAQEFAKLGVTYEAAESRVIPENKKRRDDSKAAQHSDEMQGGTFLETSKYGDEEDRVIMRKDGTPVYLLADIAYHRSKFARGFDLMVDVWGADHAGHVPRIRAGMSALGLDNGKLHFSLVQMVRLLRDGKEVRISKRSGNLLLLSELIEEIGPDAARYYFLMRSPNSPLDVDLAKATEHSMDNPVFYAQYGHARCSAIFKKAEEKGHIFKAPGMDALASLTLPEEMALLRRVASFPDRVADAARALEPHRLVFDLQTLNEEFHSYYTKYSKTDRVVSDDAVKTQARLALVKAVQITMKRTLELLGVAAPDRLDLPHAEEAAQ